MPAAIETLHPDIYVIEERGVPRVIGVGVNTGGMIGVAEKGPITRAGLVTNTSQFKEAYGSFFQGSFLEPAVRAFFQHGGQRLFISRIVGVGSAKSSATLVDHENMSAIQVDAANPGAWGDQVSLQTERYRTTISSAPGPNPPPVPSPVPPVGVGSDFVALGSVRNIKKGDLLVITDPLGSGAKIQGFVINVFPTVRVVQVTFLAQQPGTPLPPPTFGVGALVQCGTEHRATTISTQALILGQTSLTVQSTFNFGIGSRVLVADPATGFFASVLVTAVDGNTLRFAAAAPPAPLGVGSVVVSMEYNVKLFEKGLFKELHEFVSMEATNARDYFGIRLSGESNESRTIELTDLLAAPFDLLNASPLPLAKVVLAGGTDGGTPTDDDFIGEAEAPKSGDRKSVV